MRGMNKMRFEHNVKYYCMIRDLFQCMSVELVNKFGNYDKYMISIPNEKIREIFCTAGMNYYEFEKLIQNIAQKLFEEGRYYLNIIVTRDKSGQVTKINFYTKMPETIAEDQEKYVVKLKNDIKLLNCLKRRRLIHKFLNMNEYEIQNYNSRDELTYFLEKEQKDKYKFFKITKDMYIQGDTPEEITTYYHNYRVIKTRIWQVKFVQHILNRLNTSFEKIFNEKDIIKYNGISIEELNKYMEKLQENEISMSELSIKMMKIEKI